MGVDQTPVPYRKIDRLLVAFDPHPPTLRAQQALSHRRSENKTRGVLWASSVEGWALPKTWCTDLLGVNKRGGFLFEKHQNQRFARMLKGLSALGLKKLAEDARNSLLFDNDPTSFKVT